MRAAQIYNGVSEKARADANVYGHVARRRRDASAILIVLVEQPVRRVPPGAVRADPRLCPKTRPDSRVRQAKRVPARPLPAIADMRAKIRAVGDPDERLDAEALLRELLAPWRDVSWEALDKLESAPPFEGVRAAPSGRRYRVKLHGYWDMEPWESDFHVSASVYGESGLRKRMPYQDSVDYGGEGLPPEPPATTRWVKGRLGRWHPRSRAPD